VLYAVALYQNYDRASSKAIKLAKAGDPVGAIALLKAEIEVGKPSAIRFTTLGVLHSIREEWTEAYKAFLEAEAIGGRQAIHLSNLGVALLKLGRPVEAEPLLQEACALDPVSPLFACNLGRILAELGRPDEAASQLTIAEAAYKKLWSIPPSSKKPIGEEIDKLRLRLAGETSPATE
jgi:Flp pilus assembly protein TadD